jgi:uncharacterized membrane protein YdjX (TVP38/TMEM64 family)
MSTSKLLLRATLVLQCLGIIGTCFGALLLVTSALERHAKDYPVSALSAWGPALVMVSLALVAASIAIPFLVSRSLGCNLGHHEQARGK